MIDYSIIIDAIDEFIHDDDQASAGGPLQPLGLPSLVPPSS